MIQFVAPRRTSRRKSAPWLDMGKLTPNVKICWSRSARLPEWPASPNHGGLGDARRPTSTVLCDGLPGVAGGPMSESTLRELDRAALRTDLPAYGLIAGDVGTVVFVHDDGAAYEVEFMTADGDTVAVETLTAEQVEPVAGAYILHVRKHVAV